MRKKHLSRKSTPRRRTIPKVIHLHISVQKFIIGTAVVSFLLLAFVFTHKTNVRQAVAGIQIAKGFFGQATVLLPSLPDAASFNIYYKEKSESSFTNSMRNIPGNNSAYTISYLKKNGKYQYKISAINVAGREFWWSDIKTIPLIDSM